MAEAECPVVLRFHGVRKSLQTAEISSVGLCHSDVVPGASDWFSVNSVALGRAYRLEKRYRLSKVEPRCRVIGF